MDEPRNMKCSGGWDAASSSPNLAGEVERDLDPPTLAPRPWSEGMVDAAVVVLCVPPFSVNKTESDTVRLSSDTAGDDGRGVSSEGFRGALRGSYRLGEIPGTREPGARSSGSLVVLPLLSVAGSWTRPPFLMKSIPPSYVPHIPRASTLPLISLPMESDRESRVRRSSRRSRSRA